MPKPAFIWGVIIFCIFTSCGASRRPPQNRKVFIQHEEGKYVLYRDGKPYFIKGAAGYEHLPQLQAAGGNTIRIWDTAHLGQILDEAHAHNIAVIAGLPIPVSGILSYYNDPSKVAAQLSGFRSVINRYKSHPALLMWCLGMKWSSPLNPGSTAFTGHIRDC
jgi:hypothetical protein